MDDKKNPVLFAILGFCVVFMGYQFIFNWGDDFGWLKMFFGLVLASVAGGVGFFVGGMKK